MRIRPSSNASVGSWLAVGLRLVGWMAVNVLCSFGVLAIAAFAIGSFSLPGTMLQLSNLSNRFVAADPGRQGQFAGLVISALVLALCIIGFFRRGSAFAALRSEKGA